MEVAVFLDHKFDRTPDGEIWATTMFGPAFWSRYLEVFSKVCVVARLRPVDSVPESAIRVSFDNVEFVEMPYYEGPWRYWRVRRQIRATVKKIVMSGRAIILRVPQTIPFEAFRYCLDVGIPYGAEVVGDPWDMFSAGAIRHPARPFFRRWFTSNLKRCCQRAEATSYVTEKALQSRYPPAEGKFTQGISDVEIDDVISRPRDPGSFVRAPLRCISVGAFNQLYKAQDVLIRAVGIAAREGMSVELTIIGDGKYRGYLERLAAQLGGNARINFMGQLASGKAVANQLDRSDLFVLPSRQEGLPRALIEAMARGLPAIATDVGGIPELLREDCLVRPNDVAGLARKIRDFADDPELLAEHARRNLEVAAQFLGEKLDLARRSFYVNICAASEEWWAHRGGR